LGLADRWHGFDGRLSVAIIPRFTLSCSPPMLRTAGDLAATSDLRVSSHLSENLVECDLVRQRTGAADYLSTYEDAGLLRAGSVWAHCIHLSDSEWDRFAAAGAAVAHCPDSNDFLGSGGMPLAPARSRGIAVAVGTDVAAGRSFRVPRTLSHAWDNAARQGEPCSPAWLLHLGTRAGALALGLPDLGSLVPGFEADFVLHDVDADTEAPDAVAGAILFDERVRVTGAWVRGVACFRRRGEVEP
jgi:guanine deaminase